jgi:pimeloyl-ACP methyl ester carboxylesterase
MTRYKTVTVDGVNIFYREAGSANDPTILLLHGFPTSSHMYRNLRVVGINMFRFNLNESLWFDHEVHEEHEENIDIKTPSWSS